jgi:hypothetical protein
MDHQTARQLARIEGKINVIARWFVLVLMIAVAYAGAVLFRKYEWAAYYGFGLGILVGFAFESAMKGLERRLPDVDDDNS